MGRIIKILSDTLNDSGISVGKIDKNLLNSNFAMINV